MNLRCLDVLQVGSFDVDNRGTKEDHYSEFGDKAVKERVFLHSYCQQLGAEGPKDVHTTYYSVVLGV